MIWSIPYVWSHDFYTIRIYRENKNCYSCLSNTSWSYDYDDSEQYDCQMKMLLTESIFKWFPSDWVPLWTLLHIAIYFCFHFCTQQHETVKYANSEDALL